jgi:hypothetical protein
LIVTDQPQVPHQSALLYRTGYLWSIPSSPGEPSKPLTELLYLMQYGDTLVSTLPLVALGNGQNSGGTITTVKYVKPSVAAAKFRFMVFKHLEPGTGWVVADIDAFDPKDPSTLRPAPQHEQDRVRTIPAARLR